ncbi:bifunctional glutamate N-acetyltransferase/amino-acid acetyltransferase ArgJ [Saccharothrix sp.]|uniref:bifunctional glutamate N-acetyltransferase/amino-acid acetyltransferase ArgJ n=1 Tax=Saccharothrix sp. TaxID=1873460 RepID=UPI0028128DEC|nr:bifunctional glutamate N-acetyltransferase/amino-acid acetyltransferase ArgJ [Saccharothrix sp.]
MFEHVPAGFRVHTDSARILDDDRHDLTIIISETPAIASAVFTRSRFAGPSVLVSREAMRDQVVRGVVVLARNANVATGSQGLANAVEVRRLAAVAVGVPQEELLIASTGVIGVQYPMASVTAALGRVPRPLGGSDFGAAARAIMTTDIRPKVFSRRCGTASLVGIAKGIGMIEPDMATMLAFFCTDAAIPAPDLDRMFRATIATTFNAVSIDTDTSTSDTAAIFANGQAGPVDFDDFEAQLHAVALHLTREIARDGEGASKLIEVQVTGARDDQQAKRVGKAVVNSPLVKTAVHGSDPNWGRIVMAIGKCQDDEDIDPDKVSIALGDLEVYPATPTADDLAVLADEMRGDTVHINIALGVATGRFTVYGCDLTEGYVRLNSAYTT